MAGRRRFQFNKLNHEFELDLAPMLAVMVKLVPVLLLSSAFVQIMMIETDLPQAVKEATELNKKNENSVIISLDISKNKGVQIRVTQNGKTNVDSVPLLESGEFNLPIIHKKLVAVKGQHPEVFRIELTPAQNVTYDEIVKIMEEARRSRDANIKFPVFDKTKNSQIMTDYMFPDIVFSNVLEG